MSYSNYEKRMQRNMSVDDMWNTVKGNDNWGIEGYEPVIKYVDPRLQMKKREYEDNIKDQVKNPKKYWPVKKNDEIVVLKRPNYLDDVIYFYIGF